ncbi:hypothetical protein M409DRAFT_59729 [Zasmidium cellare ATCC 36951]|uniref:SsDNA binding protein n=1 Tax=Zasmidium cellare ATCC 36951 TaxID=1080233 RepID=A0A6A6C0W0_ZASCE|nr:uncharacterized protein M409DRAFT_59729 [Zasmidium cellare ATCC 36951]KAF2160697.1 hypothetical protein M409DRAFT_59729 [Zasmidium cellare ATCC 36951]
MQAIRSQIPSASRAFANSSRTFTSSARRPLARMQLIGRLADAPELFATSTGKELVRYAVGVPTGPRDEQGNRQASWYRVAAFIDEGPQRDYVLNLPKGTQVYVDADAKMDSYEVEGGQKRSSLNLVQRSIETLSRPRNQELNQSEAATQAAAGAQ